MQVLEIEVFAETRKPDLGGQLWRVQMQHTQLGLVIYIMASDSVSFMQYTSIHLFLD